LLGGINDGLIKKLLATSYGGEDSKIPVVDYLGAQPMPTRVPAGVKQEDSANATTFTIGASAPQTDAWLASLAGPRLGWLQAFLTSPTIVQDSGFVDNPIRRIFAPRAGQKVTLTKTGDAVTGITLYGGARSYGTHKPQFKAVEVKFNASSKLIDMTLFEDRRDASVPLHLQFQYRPDIGAAPIHEIHENRNHRIKEFYWRLWFGDNEALPEIDVREVFTGPEVTIKAEDIETFCDVVGNQDEAFKTARSDRIQAPMDFAIVTGWQVTQRSLW
jgi:fatty acid synthase subunit alpha